MVTPAPFVANTTTVIHTTENPTAPITLVPNASSSTVPSTTATLNTTALTTTPTVPTSTSTTINTTQATDDTTVAIACGVIFGIVGAALVIIGVIFLLRWRKRRRSKEGDEGDEGDEDNYVNVGASPREPVVEGDASHYAKLDKTKSIHDYGKFNGSAVSQPPPGPDQFYSNQEPNSGQYNNVTAAKPPTKAKKALKPPQEQNNETYEPMQTFPTPTDDNRDSQFYERMSPGTPDTYANKSNALSNADTSQNPKRHSFRASGDPGYVNTTIDDILTTAKNSNILKELPALETNHSEYVNNTTIDEIVAVGNVSNPGVKGNRTKTQL